MKATVNMVGHLTRDITNTFSNGDGTASRCLFTIACNSYYKGTDGSKKESVDFIPCIAWTGLVPTLTTWGKKGRQLQIEGSLETFQAGPDENGKYPPTKIQVRVEKFQFLDKKPKDVEDKTTASAAATTKSASTSAPEFDMNKMAEMVAAKLLGAANTVPANTQTAQNAAEAAAEQQASEGAGLDSVT